MAKWPYCWPWPQVRQAVLEHDNHVCQVRSPSCTHRATTVDHIIPWREGGAAYDPANLRAACVPCNTSRANTRRSALANLNMQPSSEPSRAW